MCGDLWGQVEVCIGSKGLLILTSGLQTDTELPAQGWFLPLAPQERSAHGRMPIGEAVRAALSLGQVSSCCLVAVVWPGTTSAPSRCRDRSTRHGATLVPRTSTELGVLTSPSWSAADVGHAASCSEAPRPLSSCSSHLGLIPHSSS